MRACAVSRFQRIFVSFINVFNRENKNAESDYSHLEYGLLPSFLMGYETNCLR